MSLSSHLNPSFLWFSSFLPWYCHRSWRALFSSWMDLGHDLAGFKRALAFSLLATLRQNCVDIELASLLDRKSVV